MNSVQRWPVPLSSALLLTLGLIGCVAAAPSSTPTATREIRLIPFSSPTPSQLAITNTPRVITSTPPPSPTPTPITYKIVDGDTMLAIALRNGITLAELQAANPEVNPRLLSVGTELVIPLGEIIPSVPMTPTPLPLNTGRPDCSPVPDGIWCFLLVTNDRSRPIENISAQIILLDPDGGTIADGIAIAPLNQLPVSEAMPLVAFFRGNYPIGTTAVANLVTAQFTPKGDDRYLNAWIEINETEFSETGKAAQVTGSFGIPKKSVPSDLVWVVAIAYDQQGEVVGFKKLELSDPLEPGGSREFALDVFSLGLPISEVKVLIEARPPSELDQSEENS